MPAGIPGPPAAISFDFWYTLVAEPGGLLGALRREAVIQALIEHQVEVEEDVLDAHLAATQALQAEAWGRGEQFEPARAAAHLADAVEGLGNAGRSRVAKVCLDAGCDAKLELSPGAARRWQPWPATVCSSGSSAM